MAGFWDWLFGGGGKKDAPAPRRDPAPKREAAQPAAPTRQSAQQSGWSRLGQQPGPVAAPAPAPRQNLNIGGAGLARGGGGAGGVFALSAPQRAEAQQSDEEAMRAQANELGVPEPTEMEGGVDPAFRQDKKNSDEFGEMFEDPKVSGAFWNQVLKTPMLGMALPGKGMPQIRQNPVQRQVTQTIKADAEDEALSAARNEYSNALGTLTLGEDGRLTWDQYSALTPLQRSAVDANEAIIQAIEADRADAGAGAVKPDDWDYDQTVERLFGREGGSDTYAPRTVKLLDELGLTNTSKGDLDNYLNGGALVSVDEIMQLGDATLPQLQATPTEQRTERENNALAFSGLAAQRAAETLSRGQTLLDTLNPDSPITPGFNPADTSGATQALEGMFEVLSHRNSEQIPLEEISAAYADVESQFGLTQSQIQDYFERRLKSAEASVASGKPVNLIGTTDDGYLDASEFRARYYSGGQ